MPPPSPPCPALQTPSAPILGQARLDRSYTGSYTKSGDSYTISYTNHPQKSCIRLNSVEHACLNAIQNEAVFVQWIKVKVKKVMVGMERFELSTS